MNWATSEDRSSKEPNATSQTGKPIWETSETGIRSPPTRSGIEYMRQVPVTPGQSVTHEGKQGKRYNRQQMKGDK